MHITSVKIEKFPVVFERPLVIAFGEYSEAVNWLVKLSTDEGLYGIGAASPFAPVTGETPESCLEVLKLFSEALVGEDPRDIGGIHRKMDAIIYGNGAAKCGIDIALYDLMGKLAGKPVYQLLGGTCPTVVNDITVGMGTPEEMAAEAAHFVQDLGFGILKVKIGGEPEEDLRALTAIRETVGKDVILRVDANQGYTVDSTLNLLPALEQLGIAAVEQPLPYWDFDGHSELRHRNHTAVRLMLDESIHNEHDAKRAADGACADYFNIKLMKCGGLYNGLKIADIAAGAGVQCMVGCMCETKVSLAAGVSLIAARDAVTEADCDSFLLYRGGDDGVRGCFERKGGTFTLSDRPGFGADLDF